MKSVLFNMLFNCNCVNFNFRPRWGSSQRHCWAPYWL